MFGARFTSQFGEIDDGTWLAVLADLTPEDLDRGLGKTARSDQWDSGWPPNAKEFRRLCMATPEDMGLPSVDEAFRRACRREWEPPLVWWARREVGSHAMGTSDRAFDRFEIAYMRLVRRYAAGESFAFPDDKPAISHDPMPKAEVVESAEQAREQMRRMFNLPEREQ